MSAFAVIFEQSNTPVELDLLERVMGRLCHRGPDGRDVLQVGNICMGHWHFWTTPEEVNERQPLRLPSLPFTIVLDGRLDNRSDLFQEMNIETSEGEGLSDAALALHAYARWGEHCFEHFIGEYALAIFDEQRGELLCARDPLGDRTLFYAVYGTRLVIASEPWAVAGANSGPLELNQDTAAHYFALQMAADGQTFYKNINELLPAHGLAATTSGHRMWRYWQPDFSNKMRGRSDEDYAEEFRSLLEQSIRCRMRSPTPMGILMSGGLDSTSVACLAARITAPQPLTTISYVFDELADCDERKYIEAVKKQWGIHSIQIPCDDAWPFKDWQDWPANPNQPEGNPYRLLKERAYQRAQVSGMRVLLSGGFGDHLYSTGSDWLADLLAEGKIRRAAGELSQYLRYAGLRWTLRAGFLQRAAKRLLNKTPTGSGLHRGHKAPDWLTPLSVDTIKSGNKSDVVLGQYDTLLGLRAASSCSGEIFNASRHSIELRHPYRDRRLVEYVLKLPAYQLYYRALYKHILRTSMRGILPELIRTRLHPTSLEPLFYKGVECEKNRLQPCFRNPGAPWRMFVRADWLLQRWSADMKPEPNLLGSIVPWLSISFEKWWFDLSIGDPYVC